MPWRLISRILARDLGKNVLITALVPNQADSGSLSFYARCVLNSPKVVLPFSALSRECARVYEASKEIAGYLTR
jgi:hypothetical protein